MRSLQQQGLVPSLAGGPARGFLERRWLMPTTTPLQNPAPTDHPWRTSC
jgi:hypothetical protein